MTMNMTEDTSSWQSAASAAEECQYLNKLKEDLKTTFFNGAKCKNSFICRIQLQKKKSGVKNGWKFVPLRGGGRGS